MAFALVALAGSAAGQNALGDGRLLDNNLSTSSRFNAPGRDIRREIQFRNAIVTGNAPNGLSFRGDVGYTAPEDFRSGVTGTGGLSSDLGSNDLFAFRRDSLTSGLAGYGLRGTEALQFQSALTTGGRPPPNLVGDYAVARSGRGFAAADLRPTGPNSDAPRRGDVGLGGIGGDVPGNIGGERRLPLRQIDPEVRLDPADRADQQTPGQRLDISLRQDAGGTLFNTLRTPSAFSTTRDFVPSYLGGAMPGEDGRPTRALIASSLRGIRTARLSADDPAPVSGESQRQRLDQRRGSDAREGGAIAQASSPTRLTPTPEEVSAARDTEPRTAYDGIMGPVRERVEEIYRENGITRELTEEDFDNGLNNLREILDEDTEGNVEREYEDESTDVVERDMEELAQILRQDGEIPAYIDPDAPAGDSYERHLQAGQRLMTEGRYFAAEERFTHALTARPGDVTAQIGRFHAQLGAGMFLSASVNYRQMVRENPEILGARFAPRLLPPAGRLEQVVSLLNEYLEPDEVIRSTVSPQLQRTAGLLLAYLGYQTERPGMIRQGLDAYERFAAASAQARGVERVNDPDLRLVPLLRRVWLDAEPDPTTSPAGAAAGTEAGDGTE